jgi:hypothetical protein
MLLSDVLAELGRSTERIAVCGATNTAGEDATLPSNSEVDRILENLSDNGFSDFARVGSVRRISKQVLPFVVRESSADKDTGMLLCSTLSAFRYHPGAARDVERQVHFKSRPK